MSGLFFDVADHAARLGVKGPRAEEWLAARSVNLPASPNTWVWSPVGGAERLLVARLGQSEFFLEQESAGSALEGMSSALAALPAGVYPVLREDFAFRLGGEGVHDALAQVCNVNFAAINLESQPVIMTLMIGVAVLAVGDAPPAGSDFGRRYRFWCDPTFGPSLSEALATVIVECGGTIRGVPE